MPSTLKDLLTDEFSKISLSANLKRRVKPPVSISSMTWKHIHFMIRNEKPTIFITLNTSLYLIYYTQQWTHFNRHCTSKSSIDNVECGPIENKLLRIGWHMKTVHQKFVSFFISTALVLIRSSSIIFILRDLSM